MAKLITRVSERTLMRRANEPHYQPWSEWEVCEGTEGQDPATLKRLASGWHIDDRRYITGSGDGWQLRAEGPYSHEEYRVVDDGFDVEDYNKRLAE